MGKTKVRKEVKTTIKSVLYIFALIGLLLALYQTGEHYFFQSDICDVSESFSCSIVTESQYGEFPINSGIALALLGVFYWLILIYLLKKDNPLHIFLWLLIGLSFVFYLVFIELYLLPMETGIVALCPFCTVQHAIIILGLILSLRIQKTPILKEAKRLFTKDKARTIYVLVASLIIFGGGYIIADQGTDEIDHYQFTACLAEQKATVYGFDACPNCNKQKHLLGVNAYNENLDQKGLYIKCRPEKEANIQLGESLNRISILSKYANQVDATTTHGELCALMVGDGTPTWIIHDQQVSGWQTLEQLSELSGCEVVYG